ncbi:hypothetical protein CU633_06900 [Bacillus sp. V3-13]|uniref:glycosyltransferase n=1 Tax=Bacillus sp. V3-13 TaxID=2053728 RepID=UPI000C778225|nr:glycosyltransferase [Bacillus sp. V3-13]PLR78238.1 hypothetical protein CU633_06900 [Bacillus sp. V3-13]
MDSNKQICFIYQVKDERKFLESIEYIKALHVPEDHAIEIITIHHPNEVNDKTNANYKIFISEDVFILDKNFLLQLIKVFNDDSSLGLLGVAGSKIIPESLIWLESNHKVGQFYTSRQGHISRIAYSESTNDLYEEVSLLEGSLLATQLNFDYLSFNKEEILFNVELSLETAKKEFRVGVINNDEPFVLLDKPLGKFKRGSHYKEAKQAIVNHYELPDDEFNSAIDKSELPLVSILIPTYNRPDYFELALKSALDQTYSNIEIIIGDDSTNNETEKIVRENYLPYYNHIIYIKNEKNLGQFENDLMLMEKAAGEYINFLMDDDLFHPEKIEKMMRYFQTEDDISLVTSHRQIIDSDGKYLSDIGATQRLFQEDRVVEGSWIIDMFLTYNWNFIGEPTTVLFRKRDLEVPFGTYKNRQYGCNVDTATWMNVLKNRKAAYISETLSYFRFHEGQQQLTEDKVLDGMLDYTHQMYYAREDGYLNTKEKFVEAVENCLSIVEKIVDKKLRNSSLTNSEKFNELIVYKNNLKEILKETEENKDDVEETHLIERNKSFFNSFVTNVFTGSSTNDFNKRMDSVKLAATSAWLLHPGLFVSTDLENEMYRIAGELDKIDFRYMNIEVPYFEKGKKHFLHVLTSAYETGGHTRLVERWITNRSNYEETHSVIIINQEPVPYPESLKETAEKAGGFFVILSDLSFIERAKYLRELALRAADIVVLHIHPNDPIPLVAFGIEEGIPPIIFLNHADHVFWMGAGISDMVADLRKAGQDITLNRRLAKKSSILPIPLNDQIAGGPRSSYKRKIGVSENSTVLLSIASSYKYSPLGKYNFMSILTEILNNTEDAILIIVGPDPNEPVWQEAARQAPGKLKVIKHTPAIEDFYRAADFYIESFPVGSLTSTLDAVLYGLPVIRQPFPIAGILAIDKYDGMNENAKSVRDYVESTIKSINNHQLAQAAHKLQYRDVFDNHVGKGWNEKLDKLLKFLPSAHQVEFSNENSTDPDHYDNVWAELQLMHGQTQSFLRNILK